MAGGKQMQAMTTRIGLAYCGMLLAATAWAGDGPQARAMETALSLIDTYELPPVEMPRLRYVVRIEPAQDGNYRIDAARYNLGEAVRREAIAAYGAEQVDTPAAFGVGPHVAWRLRLQADASGEMRMADATRRTISRAAAKRARCGVQACLALDDVDALQPWQPLTAPATSAGKTTGGEEPLAQIAHALLAALGTRDAGGQALELVIDRNLGEDSGSDALLGWSPRAGQAPACWLRRRASEDGAFAEYQRADAACMGSTAP